jgi:hypothetical protein
LEDEQSSQEYIRHYANFICLGVLQGKVLLGDKNPSFSAILFYYSTGFSISGY